MGQTNLPANSSPDLPLQYCSCSCPSLTPLCRLQSAALHWNAYCPGTSAAFFGAIGATLSTAGSISGAAYGIAKSSTGAAHLGIRNHAKYEMLHPSRPSCTVVGRSCNGLVPHTLYLSWTVAQIGQVYFRKGLKIKGAKEVAL